MRRWSRGMRPPRPARRSRDAWYPSRSHSSRWRRSAKRWDPRWPNRIRVPDRGAAPAPAPALPCLAFGTALRPSRSLDHRVECAPPWREAFWSMHMATHFNRRTAATRERQRRNGATSRTRLRRVHSALRGSSLVSSHAVAQGGGSRLRQPTNWTDVQTRGGCFNPRAHPDRGRDSRTLTSIPAGCEPRRLEMSVGFGIGVSPRTSFVNDYGVGSTAALP